MNRRDVSVDDIASNLRFVGITDFRAVTVTLLVEEADDFEAWCVTHQLEYKAFKIAGHDTAQFILTNLTEAMVLMIKLTWARPDLASSRRMLG